MPNLKKEHQRPEGELLEAALAGPPKMSMRTLAKRAGLSEGRVRQIVNGYQSQAGQVLSIAAPSSTLARLALAAGLSANDLASAGREDAADELRGLLAEQAAGAVSVRPDREEAARELREWVEAGATGAPPVSTLGLFTVYQLLDGLRDRIKDAESATRIQMATNRRLRSLKGGDGDDRGAASMNEAADADVSAADDELPAAAKKGNLEQPGEFTT